MTPSEDQVAVLERWRDSGAGWRVLELRDRHAVVELLTCLGEPADRLESSDPALVRFLREVSAEDAADS